MAVAPVYPALRRADRLATHLAGPGLAITEWRVAGARLFTAPRRHGSDALASGALALAAGGAACGWRVVRSAAGRPEGQGGGAGARPISLAAAAELRAVAVASSGAIGVDAETPDRIARNTRPDDDWLTDDERALLLSLGERERAAEIACRWVLREACGKALGLGLGAWRVPPAFTLRSGEIALDRAPGRGAAWAIGLYRADGLLLAIACAA